MGGLGEAAEGDWAPGAGGGQAAQAGPGQGGLLLAGSGWQACTMHMRICSSAPQCCLGACLEPTFCPTPALPCPSCPVPQEEMVRRLAAGARSGRASTAEKALEKLKADGTYVEKPFVPKKR